MGQAMRSVLLFVNVRESNCQAQREQDNALAQPVDQMVLLCTSLRMRLELGIWGQRDRGSMSLSSQTGRSEDATHTQTVGMGQKRKSFP